MKPLLEPALTVHDVATLLSVDEKTVYRLAQRGDIPGFKVAGAWRFQRAALEAWIDSKTVRPDDEHPTPANGSGKENVST